MSHSGMKRCANRPVCAAGMSVGNVGQRSDERNKKTTTRLLQLCSHLALCTGALIIGTHGAVAGPTEQARDNKRCLQCHENLAMEPLTVQHMDGGITCMECHGESSPHVADKQAATPPDILHGRTEVDLHCGSCHEAHRNLLAIQAFIDLWAGGRRPNGRVVNEESACTDCHGIHSVAVDPAEPSKWRPLFNGVDLDGWTATGGARWTVENEMIVGQQGDGGEAGDLLTVNDYDDFVLRAAFRVVWPANSGIWFRYQTPDVAYQADILEYKDPVAWSGTLYCPGKMFLAKNEDESSVRRDGWNTMEIRAEGDRIRIEINGHLVADVRDNTTDHGKIGFQVHPGDEMKSMKIYVRDLILLPLQVNGK